MKHKLEQYPAAATNKAETTLRCRVMLCNSDAFKGNIRLKVKTELSNTLGSFKSQMR